MIVGSEYYKKIHSLGLFQHIFYVQNWNKACGLFLALALFISETCNKTEWAFSPAAANGTVKWPCDCGSVVCDF